MRAMARPVRLVLLLACSVVVLAAAGSPTDPYYETRSEWDEETQGPLPRWREGGTPEPEPGRPFKPYSIDLSSWKDAADTGVIESPPEYSPTAGVLFRYSTSSWASLVTDLVAALTGDPAHDEIAYVVVSSSSQQASAASQFAAAGADLSKVQFIIMPNDSIWLRDYGPHFIWQDGAQAIVDSHYYPSRPLDNFIPTLLADDYFLMPSYDIGLYYSGGNFQPGPNRSGFITSLIDQDNPGFGEAFIAELYQTYQGIDTLHVFPRLPSSVDGTGHIDMWMYLVDEDTVIISEFEPGSHPDAITITNEAADYMENVLGFEVFRVPDKNGPHAQTSNAHFTYTNAFRVNDRIFMSRFRLGDINYKFSDLQAAQTFQAAAPDAEIIPIDSYDIIWAAGALHCIVMQVPRYTSPVPSAAVISPSGGELLVPGTIHEVSWAATDDATVDSIDLLYSTDGGAVFDGTIAVGEPDDGAFLWTVPPELTDGAIVKVVAHDDEGNQDDALSATDFTIMGAQRHVYDFGSGAGVDKWAWGHQTQNWSELDGVRRPAGVATEIPALQAGAYTRIAASDASGGDTDVNRYGSPVPSSGAESTHIFELVIAEDLADIVDIEVFWEGYGDDCLQMELYVWDHVAGQWCDGRGQCGENRFMDNQAANRDAVLSGHIRSDFGRYVDGAGLLTLLLYAERSTDRSMHDYISVTVTHETCAPFPNGDGDLIGDACDCAPADGTVFAVPQEIGNVIVGADKATIEWDSDAPASGSGTVYDVLRGSLASLPVGSGAETCLEPGWAAVTYADTEDPPSESGFFYLVRGVNGCGTGGYGLDSVEMERTSTACP